MHLHCALKLQCSGDDAIAGREEAEAAVVPNPVFADPNACLDSKVLTQSE